MSDPSPSRASRMARHSLWAVPSLVLLVVAVLALVRPGGASMSTAGAQVFGVTRESDGAVMVALTPKSFADGRLVMEMGVNTHTVNDLDRYDLTRIVFLKVGDREIAPEAAPSLHGHHNAGELVFPLETMPEAFSVEIRNLNGAGVRTYSWP